MDLCLTGAVCVFLLALIRFWEGKKPLKALRLDLTLFLVRVKTEVRYRVSFPGNVLVLCNALKGGGGKNLKTNMPAYRSLSDIVHKIYIQTFTEYFLNTCIKPPALTSYLSLNCRFVFMHNSYLRPDACLVQLKGQFWFQSCLRP